LRKRAQRLWKTLVPQLEAMGVLGKCDRNALARYCQLCARYEALEKFLAEHGEVAESESGSRARPEASLSLKIAAELLRLEGQFGLTPSARAGLARPKENPRENRGKGRFFKGSA